MTAIAYCKDCGTRIAEAKNVEPREQEAHTLRAPFLFTCRTCPKPTWPGKFRIEWTP